MSEANVSLTPNPQSSPAAHPSAGEREHLTVNLHARDDFDKGDIGYVRGYEVSKATEPETLKGSNLVTALQDVKAGTNGWFEHH